MSLAMIAIFVVVAIAFAGLKRKSQQRAMLSGRPRGIRVNREKREVVKS